MYLESSISHSDDPVKISYIIQSLLNHNRNTDHFTKILAEKDYSDEPLIVKINAIFALYICKYNTDKADNLFDSIISEQNENGSWEDDSYITALILKTIATKTNITQKKEYCKIFDSQLQAAINFSLNKNFNDLITIDEIESLKYLNASNFSISDLSGLEYAKNLEYADFQNNKTIKNYFAILNKLPKLVMARCGRNHL